MKIGLSFFLMVLLSAVSTVPSSAASDRYALVIGNAKYPDADAPLKEPVNDAREVAEELKRDGFNVDLGENLTGNNMRRAFDAFYGKLRPGSVALIFFSGFGLQSNRQSYMIPVDAQLWTEQDIRREGFSLETVLGEINSRGAGVKIALIDASRHNPYERRFRSFSAGLAPTIAPNGTLAMYSAALSSTVSDSGGDHSLFVQELLRQIRVPDLMAEEALNRVRVGVTRASHGDQVPWVSSSLVEDFSFAPGDGRSPAPPPVMTPGALPPSAALALPTPVASLAPPPAVVTPLKTPAPASAVSANAAAPANTHVPTASTPPLQPPVAIGRRVALILGNSSYKSMPSLQNPRNDAVDVESALKTLGFETVMATDLDLDGMGKAIGRFSRLVRGADVAIVYYSGHGMQFNGKNYLLPIDASLESAADVDRYHVVPVDDLIQVLGGANAGGLQLVVLDACRNNPVERDFKNKVASAPGANRDAASTRGFARIDARNGLIITYATAPNDVAADGTGRNSPFTQAFLKDVAIPDLDVRQMLFRVQSDVYQSSGSKQLPEISSLYVGPEVRLKTSQR
jgi:uncharacterized caspase-like protein